jgi:hypothetical protein
MREAGKGTGGVVAIAAPVSCDRSGEMRWRWAHHPK